MSEYEIRTLAKSYHSWVGQIVYSYDGVNVTDLEIHQMARELVEHWDLAKALKKFLDIRESDCP